MVHPLSANCAECLRWPFMTLEGERYFWQGIGWESNRCSTPLRRTAWPSRAKYRLCWSSTRWIRDRIGKPYMTLQPSPIFRHQQLFTLGSGPYNLVSYWKPTGMVKIYNGE